MNSILSIACESAKKAGAAKVTQIDLVVGELTQTVPEAMEFAFNALSAGTMCEGATLNMHMVAPKSVCLTCEKEFTHDILHFKCPNCGSIYTKVVAGDELLIDKIEVDN